MRRAWRCAGAPCRGRPQQRGQRLLVVRTSGTGQGDRTRALYRGLGYVEQTRVPDYWTDGDDLVLFTKRLAT